MFIKAGLKYEIANNIKDIYYNSEYLTIVRMNEKTIQFMLDEGKSRGSMPIQHFQYLLKRNELKPFPMKHQLITEE